MLAKKNNIGKNINHSAHTITDKVFDCILKAGKSIHTCLKKGDENGALCTRNSMRIYQSNIYMLRITAYEIYEFFV